MLEEELKFSDGLFALMIFLPPTVEHSTESDEVEEEHGLGEPVDGDGGVGDVGGELDHVDDVLQQQVSGEGDDFPQRDGNIAGHGSDETEEHGKRNERAGDEEVADGRNEREVLKVQDDDRECHDLGGKAEVDAVANGEFFRETFEGGFQNRRNIDQSHGGEEGELKSDIIDEDFWIVADHERGGEREDDGDVSFSFRVQRE